MALVSYKRVVYDVGCHLTNTEQWHAQIGNFNGWSLRSIVELHVNLPNLLFNIFLVIFCVIAITVISLNFKSFYILTTLFLYALLN